MSDGNKNLPDFLEEGDGYIDIALYSAAKIGGVEMASIRMREPTVRDLKIAQTGKSHEQERESKLFANLCQVTPEDIDGLTLRNYRRLGSAFEVFTD